MIKNQNSILKAEDQEPFLALGFCLEYKSFCSEAILFSHKRVPSTIAPLLSRNLQF